jgi:hypothetical protein
LLRDNLLDALIYVFHIVLLERSRIAVRPGCGRKVVSMLRAEEIADKRSANKKAARSTQKAAIKAAKRIGKKTAGF